jgi:hypothetical protein
MSFEDDMVLVDQYFFDEDSFLKSEVKSIEKLLKTAQFTLPQAEITTITKYKAQIDSLIKEYRDKTIKPKNIAWTVDDQVVLELYNRLIVHKSRLDIVLSAQSCITSQIPAPVAVGLDDKKEEKEQKEKEQKEKEIQNQGEIEQLKSQLAEMIAKNTLLAEQLAQSAQIEEQFKEPEEKIEEANNEEENGENGENNNDRNNQNNQNNQNNENNNDEKKNWFLPREKNGKYSTAKAVDYQQFREQYIETLLNEIDRLSLLSQDQSKVLVENKELIDKLQGDNLYYQILTNMKQTEITNLEGQVKQWEAYSTQQENEVRELNTIIMEQVHQKGIEMRKQLKRTKQDEGGDKDDKDGKDGKEADGDAVDGIKKSDEIGIENNPTTASIEGVSEGIVDVIVEKSDEIQQGDEETTEESTKKGDIVEETEEAEKIENKPQVVAETSQSGEKQDELLTAAKEIADVSKQLLLKTQDELETLREQFQRVTVQYNETRDHLDVEEQERRALVQELIEERDIRRSQKIKLETTQAQVMKLLQQTSELVETNSSLQTRIEFCLLNHSVIPDDD